MRSHRCICLLVGLYHCLYSIFAQFSISHMCSRIPLYTYLNLHYTLVFFSSLPIKICTSKSCLTLGAYHNPVVYNILCEFLASSFNIYAPLLKSVTYSAALHLFCLMKVIATLSENAVFLHLHQNRKANIHSFIKAVFPEQLRSCRVPL